VSSKGGRHLGSGITDFNDFCDENDLTCKWLFKVIFYLRYI